MNKKFVLTVILNTASIIVLSTYFVQVFRSISFSPSRVVRSVFNVAPTAPPLPNCSDVHTKSVGRIPIEQDMKRIIEFNDTLKAMVNKGGWWTPSTCNPVVKVAVIVPFRNRDVQLKIFLHHMHPFLQKQNVFYRIIVVEQLATDPFNRAGLFNIGFKEALKISPFDCFVFTDVDLLPEDDRNFYGCPTSPRHMSSSIDKFSYRPIGVAHFGGVCAFKKSDYEKVNGMSNIFWGWGGEDDDLYTRVLKVGLKVSRPPVEIARYTMIRKDHTTSSPPYEGRKNLIVCARERMGIDGLNGLKYHVMELVEGSLVTIVKVELRKKDYTLLKKIIVNVHSIFNIVRKR